MLPPLRRSEKHGAGGRNLQLVAVLDGLAEPDRGVAKVLLEGDGLGEAEAPLRAELGVQTLRHVPADAFGLSRSTAMVTSGEV